MNRNDRSSNVRAYTEEGFARVLEGAGVKSFEDLWGLERNWVQPVNTRRGGTSGVCRKTWDDPATGGARVFYVKYQVNHFCRGWIPFLRVFPVSRREAKNLLLFEAHGIPGAKLVYHHERRQAGDLRTILITAEVKGAGLREYLKERPLDEALKQELAKLLAQVHCELGYVHRAFNIDHLIVNEGKAQLIDLELARPRRWSRRPAISDVAALLGDLRSKCKVSKENCRDILMRYAVLSRKEAELGKWAAALGVAVK